MSHELPARVCLVPGRPWELLGPLCSSPGINVCRQRSFPVVPVCRNRPGGVYFLHISCAVVLVEPAMLESVSYGSGGSGKLNGLCGTGERQFRGMACGLLAITADLQHHRRRRDFRRASDWFPCRKPALPETRSIAAGAAASLRFVDSSCRLRRSLLVAAKMGIHQDFLL